MPTFNWCGKDYKVSPYAHSSSVSDGECEVPNLVLEWNGESWTGAADSYSISAQITGFDSSSNAPMCTLSVSLQEGLCSFEMSETSPMPCPPDGTLGIVDGHGYDLPDCCDGKLGYISTVAYLTDSRNPNSTQIEAPVPCTNTPPGECCSSVGESCNSGTCGGTNSVNLSSGQMNIEENDLNSNGFAKSWGHTRKFMNRLSSPENLGNGYYWKTSQLPNLVIDYDGNVTVMGENQVSFNKSGDNFEPIFELTHDTLTYDSGSQIYAHTTKDGTETEFNGATKMFTKQTSPGGSVIEVKSLNSNGFNVAVVEREDTASDVTERQSYSYSTDSGDTLLSTVTLQRKEGAGAWTNIERAQYVYYENNDANGIEEDLKTVATQEWNGTTWEDTGTSYYRYYGADNSSSSSSSSSGGIGGGAWGPKAHLLKYSLSKESYVRLLADPAVTDPFTASNATVAKYANFHFDYDDEKRVIKQNVNGTSQTFTYSYVGSLFDDGFNSWKYKSTETRPDGTQNIVYSNFAYQTMLSVHKDGTDEWISFRKYDSIGRPVLSASSSAITGYNQGTADLLDYNTSTLKYTYLRDNDGLIDLKAYDPLSGYLSRESVQEGQLGTQVKVREIAYVPRSNFGGGSSSSSSSGSAGYRIWMKSRETAFPSASNQNEKIITNFSYTWYDGTCQIKEKTTTLPAVSASQNGSGVRATAKQYFDLYGNNVWNMDQRGFIHRTKYDIPTGVVTQTIQDVDTSIETDHPIGWATPSGGGLNLITDYEHNSHGQVTQTLGPAHEIDLDGTATTIRRATWTVYDETSSQNTVTSAQGYATGSSPSYTYTLVNPVSIGTSNKNGKSLESIQATRASTSGKLLSTDTFARSSYTRFSTYQYTGCCQLKSERVYHTIPATGDGTSGTNYDQSDYGYDEMKRQIKSITPGGTISRTVFDSHNQVVSTWVGTDDTGATVSDPTGSSAPGNNMVIISASEYDDDADAGNGNLTKQTQYADATDTRVTNYTYDFRNRTTETETDGEIDYFQKNTFDNLNRTTKTERYDTTSAGNLIARSETSFDDLGRAYQQTQYGVDPATGTVGNSLVDKTWFDAAGNVIKSLPSGSDLFTKTVFDSLGRSTVQYVGYDLDETSYADASTVTGDTILEQSETVYDDASNVIESISRQRYHDAAASQTGELKNPSTTPKARVTYSASYSDTLGRNVASANYGTNGGTVLSRSSTIPVSSDTILVSSQAYNDSGTLSQTTDAAGLVVQVEYDDVGRETKRTRNPQASSSSTSGGSCDPSDDANVIVETAYNADGNVDTLTAVNSNTGNQVTEYTYGTTLSDSDVASSLLLRTETYPDSADSSDVITFSYNRQNQQATRTDQVGSVHSFDYDKRGRMTQDRVTTLGTNVDGAVRRIAITYNVSGQRGNVSSYDNASAGSGSVVNEVEFAYNDFGQLTTEYQSHSGAVNTSTTPKVQYAFANGSDNYIRPTSMTYPDGRVLNYDYGTASGIDDVSSRINALVDDDGPSTHLVDYSYLGSKSFVIANRTVPDIKWTLVDLSSTNDTDTGDIYSGLDRFGRVKDNRWYDYGSSTDADRIKYGYDRAGNRLWRQNVVADALSQPFDEIYDYDAVHRLKSMERGTLNAGKDTITSKQFEQCWSLDSVGNWDKFLEDTNGNNTWDLEQSRTTNVVNEITNITETAGSSWATPSYNANGNMTSIPKPNDLTSSYTATWDAWNRLVKLVDGANTVASYEYDALNRRDVKEVYTSGTLSETRHVFFSNQWQILEERVDSATSVDQQFVWGIRFVDDLVLRETTSETLYALQDANWNVVALSDSSGNIKQRFAYNPYGESIELDPDFTAYTGTDYAWQTRFTGRELDLDTGLNLHRNRYLHLQLGIWISRDPIGYADGYSLYGAYLVPNSIDPSGLQAGPEYYPGDGVYDYDIVPSMSPAARRQRIISRLCIKFSKACPKCTTAKCNDFFNRILDTTYEVPFTVDYGTDTCIRWANSYQSIFEGDKIHYMKECGTVLTEMWSTNYTDWWWRYTTEHMAVRIKLCDGSVIYLDNGHLGGPGHLFGPKDIPASYGPVKTVTPKIPSRNPLYPLPTNNPPITGY